MRSLAAVVAAVLADVTCRTCRVSLLTVEPAAAPLRRPGFDNIVLFIKQYIIVANNSLKQNDSILPSALPLVGGGINAVAAAAVMAEVEVAGLCGVGCRVTSVSGAGLLIGLPSVFITMSTRANKYEWKKHYWIIPKHFRASGCSSFE